MKTYNTQGIVAELIEHSLGSGYLIEHLPSGKPLLNPDTHDISISHKGEKVFLGITEHGFRIGVDMEKFDKSINVRTFKKHALSKKENALLEDFCRKNNLLPQYGISLFWSVKEAFFKSLGSKIIPNSALISKISENHAELTVNEKIKGLMEENGLGFACIRFKIKRPYIYSVVLLEKAPLQRLLTI